MTEVSSQMDGVYPPWHFATQPLLIYYQCYLIICSFLLCFRIFESFFSFTKHYFNPIHNRPTRMENTNKYSISATGNTFSLPIRKHLKSTSSEIGRFAKTHKVNKSTQFRSILFIPYRFFLHFLSILWSVWI